MDTTIQVSVGFGKIENLDDLCTNTILEWLFHIDMKSYISCISTSKTMYEFDYRHRKRWMDLIIKEYPNLCGIERSNEFILEHVNTTKYAKYLCMVNRLSFDDDNDRIVTLKPKLRQLEKIEFINNDIEIQSSHFRYINQLYIVNKPTCLSWKQHYIHIKILKFRKVDKYEILARYIFTIFSQYKYSDMIWMYKEYLNYLKYLNEPYGHLKRIHVVLDNTIYVLACNGYYNVIFDIIDSDYIIKAFKHMPLNMVLEYVDDMINKNEMNAVDICEDMDDVHDVYRSNYRKYLSLTENFPDRFYILSDGLQAEYVFAIMKKFNRLNLDDMIMFINNGQYKVADLIMNHLKNTKSGEWTDDIAFHMITHYRAKTDKVINYIMDRQIYLTWETIFYKLADDSENSDDDDNSEDKFSTILDIASLQNKLPTFDGWMEFIKNKDVSIYKRDISTTVMRNAGLIPYKGSI